MADFIYKINDVGAPVSVRAHRGGTIPAGWLELPPGLENQPLWATGEGGLAGADSEEATAWREKQDAQAELALSDSAIPRTVDDIKTWVDQLAGALVAKGALGTADLPEWPSAAEDKFAARAAAREKI